MIGLSLLGFVGVIGIAAFRATYLWRYDVIFENIRDYIFSWFPAENMYLPKIRRNSSVAVQVTDDNGQHWYQAAKPSKIGDLLACYWCVSAYITLLLGAAVAWSGVLVVAWPAFVVVWFASWGVAVILLQHVTNKNAHI